MPAQEEDGIEANFVLSAPDGCAEEISTARPSNRRILTLGREKNGASEQILSNEGRDRHDTRENGAERRNGRPPCPCVQPPLP
mmetsp:Transcript_59174/g.175871  ORF Transcript_59174/g.175871 Transcript_59174/m.175871 type:complete len:83 (-) Transcript_59174:44-292(-)